MNTHLDSYEEERREVLDSVLEALNGASDPDEMAACAFLARHLSGYGEGAERLLTRPATRP